MHNLSKTLVTLLLLTSISSVVVAQGTPPKIKFSCVSWKSLSITQIYYQQGKQFHPIHLSPGNRSELFELEMPVLSLYTKEFSEKGEASYRLIGKGKIPSGTKRVLYFIREVEEEGSLPLQLAGIDDSLSAFPRGSTRFSNLTSTPLVVEFAGERSKIKPRGMTTVKSKVEEKGALLPFWIKTLKGQALYENRYFAQEIGRDMFFILPPASKGGRLNIRLLPQLISDVSEQ